MGDTFKDSTEPTSRITLLGITSWGSITGRDFIAQKGIAVRCYDVLLFFMSTYVFNMGPLHGICALQIYKYINRVHLQ